MKISIGKNIAANYLCNNKAIGGFIRFEEKKFRFKPHPVNAQKEKVLLKYSQIDYAEPCDSPCPTFMSVFTKKGEEYNFAVWDREDVIAFINRKAHGRKPAVAITNENTDTMNH